MNERQNPRTESSRPKEIYEIKNPLYDEAGRLTEQGKIVAAATEAAEASAWPIPSQLARQRNTLEEGRITDQEQAILLASRERYDRTKEGEALEAGKVRHARRFGEAANRSSSNYLNNQLSEMKGSR